MKLKQFTAALLLASALSAPAFADVSKNTQDFVTNATIGNRFEIETSKLALDRSEDDAVREFAKQMVEDHTHALETMKSVVPSDTPPHLGDNYDPKHEAELQKLRDADDAHFDDAYVAAQRKAHAEAVSLFSNYAKKGDAKDLKDFANATLPTLKMHQAHITGLKRMGNGQGYESTMETKTPVSNHMIDKKPSPMAVERH